MLQAAAVFNTGKKIALLKTPSTFVNLRHIAALAQKDSYNAFLGDVFPCTNFEYLIINYSLCFKM